MPGECLRHLPGPVRCGPLINVTTGEPVRIPVPKIVPIEDTAFAICENCFTVLVRDRDYFRPMTIDEWRVWRGL
jgi:hypothetical protein